MPIHISDIARLFTRLADLLEIEGANPFRVRAYRNAARTVEDLPRSVDSLLREGAELSELPGIGDDLAGKMREIVDTGRLAALAEAEARVPKGLAEVAALPGLGPKRSKALYERLGVTGVTELERAAKAGKVRALAGFGAKTEAKILAEIARRAGAARRTPLIVAEEVAEPLLAYLRATGGVKEAAIAGSYRRRKETVGDLDILVAAARGGPAVERFVAYEDVERVLAKGPTRASVVLRSGLQVDLRVVREASYGAALHYFTGSKAHNIAVRKLGVGRGLKINEYGVFKGGKRIGGRTEAEVYRRVGLRYIEPELREDRGEIEAARTGRLPRLVTLADIRGELHAHTTDSDGKNTLAEMAEAARARGYEYLAVTDHSKHVTVANGLDEKRLARQIGAIDRLNARLKGFRVLRSCEVDILEDGRLDLDDAVLAELDFTICSVHYRLDLPASRQTERILRAMDNPRFTILGHPTGRLIGRRGPSQVDMERLMRAARERGCYMEINAQPERLDLSDLHVKMAKGIGLKVAVGTDAHSTRNLDFMRLGIDQARRGWLAAADVLNARPWRELETLFRRR